MEMLSQENVCEVLRNFVDYLEELETEDREIFVEDIEAMLDEMHCMDAFGTEGQNDPRGDRRE